MLGLVLIDSLGANAVNLRSTHNLHLSEHANKCANKQMYERQHQKGFRWSRCRTYKHAKVTVINSFRSMVDHFDLKVGSGG